MAINFILEEIFGINFPNLPFVNLPKFWLEFNFVEMFELLNFNYKFYSPCVGECSKYIGCYRDEIHVEGRPRDFPKYFELHYTENGCD